MTFKRVIITPGTMFYQVFQQVIKQTPKETKEVKIKWNNSLYQFNFEWQDDAEICGIDVFEIIEDKS